MEQKNLKKAKASQEVPNNQILARLSLWASGKGSNVEALCKYFHAHPARPLVEVACVLSNKKDAGVWKVAERWGKEELPILFWQVFCA